MFRLYKPRYTKVFLLGALAVISIYGCVPTRDVREEKTALPDKFGEIQTKDTLNTANLNWREFFQDPQLIALIDTALVNNQELNIMLQQVSMAKNEIRARKGEYLPSVNIGAAAEVEKVGRYTSQGASDANTDIRP